MCRRLQLLQPNRDFWCDRRESTLRWFSLLIAIDAGLFCVTAIEFNMVLIRIETGVEEAFQAALRAAPAWWLCQRVELGSSDDPHCVPG